VDHQDELPEARAFLLSDSKKCTGCHSCMLTCAMAHEGMAQHRTARINIAEDRFGSYPVDILIATCRHCKDPACLHACKFGALQIDPEHLNARIIDRSLCTGCRKCIRACHFQPSRIRYDAAAKKSVKCDLCRDTPYWPHEKGRLACVEVCPVNALGVTTEAPLGQGGYEVNLRKKGWDQLDLPTD
jgi:protein NrfC